MSESDHQTISLHVSEESKPIEKPEQEKPSRSTWTRRSLIALVGVVMLLLGCGAWRYWNSIKSTNDIENLAELDGIEAVAPLFNTDKKPILLTALAEKSNPTARNKTVPPAAPQAGAANSSNSSTGSTSNHAEVWLTGNIEVDEPEERIPLPQRISGEPNDSSTLR